MFLAAGMLAASGHALVGQEPRTANLPTDRGLPTYDQWLEQRQTPIARPLTTGQPLIIEEPAPAPSATVPAQQLDFAKLMRPRFRMAFEWEPEANGLEVASYDINMTVPTYPIFGPPPPFIDTGFSYTTFSGAAAALDVPSQLYDVSFGASWIRRINERWTLRLAGGAAYASDSVNESSQAWQFRGMAFAMYRPNECWNWAFGAVATGRQDLPVIPAVGVIWQPTSRVRLNVVFPQPRISYAFHESARRQHWIYAGAGLSGGTWAYRSNTGANDLITYREWRAVIGWEATPPKKRGEFFTPGTKFGLELGYAFSREFEFDSGRPDLSFGDGFLFRATASF